MSRTKEKQTRRKTAIPVQNAEISLTHILDVLVNEVVRERVRIRALLQVLQAKGMIDISEYVAAYEQQEDQSFVALADMMLLPRDAFLEKHSDWLKSDAGGLFAAIRKERLTPRLSLTPVEEPNRGKPSDTSSTNDDLTESNPNGG